MQKLSSLAVFAAAIFLVTGGMSLAYGQQSANTGMQNGTISTQQSNVSNTDKNFVENTLKGGMLEIALAQEAVKKSTNQDVQNLANHIIQDHTKGNQQLKEIAQKEGLQIPDKMGSDKEQKLEKFSKMDAQDFDREYASFEVKDHKDDIKDAENEAKDGTNPSIKNFASQLVPQLQQHLSMAQSVDQKFGANETTKAAWWEFWKKG